MRFTPAEYPQVRVFDEEEQLAVWEERIEGFVYDDGETYASVESLDHWRFLRKRGTTIAERVDMRTAVGMLNGLTA